MEKCEGDVNGESRKKVNVGSWDGEKYFYRRRSQWIVIGTRFIPIGKLKERRKGTQNPTLEKIPSVSIFSLQVQTPAIRKS